ncbi:hypothetical protein DTW89_10785 [Acidovorax sp. BoFeN1]|uniref:hypothetical protein n=1 Tax=Acidovorax sp. BoFeN1 TaxID=1231053 RepID=UPI000E095071|nr:hypothetical protein [Acidovorax sp. BoFeN1]RDD92965.1 hypothetical protein DTW89_10785 [Acidovorax sp. BoFeN1]
MSTTSKPLDVFQDLYLRGPASAVAALHQALKDRTAPPWRYATEKEEQLRELGEEGDALAFERAVTPGYEAAGLMLIADGDGLKVANIVPLELSELSHRAYNAILEDFASQIARPAAMDAGCSVVMSSSTLQLENVVPPAVAEALRRFSVLANKSTGASHPMDRDRWFDFILLAHRENAQLDASVLARWLSESEGWLEDCARDLAGEYERSRSLLTRYEASA